MKLRRSARRRACVAAVAGLLSASCSPAPGPSPAPARHTVSSASPSAAPSEDAGATEPTAAPPWDEFPTIQNAGAESCKIASVLSLGPVVEDAPVVAFGRTGGLAAWKQNEATLALQALSADGALVGSTVTTPLEANLRVARVYALDRVFVVLLRLWDWQKHDVRWWGVVVSARGEPLKGPVDLDMADMDIRVGQAPDGQRIALVLMPADIAARRDSLHGRWQTVTLGAGGTLESKATKVSVDDLVTLGTEAWEPAALAGQRGWVVLRDGIVRPEGLFDGKRVSSAGAVPLRPKDGIVAKVYSTAVPPPRGPGGTIYEALPNPALRRTHDGKPAGAVLGLEARGTHASYEVVWSGTHFVYPWRQYGGTFVAMLSTIDCRPP
jgi:hypothetical protein